MPFRHDFHDFKSTLSKPYILIVCFLDQVALMYKKCLWVNRVAFQTIQSVFNLTFFLCMHAHSECEKLFLC